MSIERLKASFDWGRDAAEALAHAEELVKQLCRPTVGYRSAPRALAIGLEQKGGQPLLAVVEEVCAMLASCGHAVRHRRSLAHMVPPPATVSVIGEFLKAGANQCAFTAEQAPLAPLVEDAVLRWIAETLGFTERTGGLVTSGGTISNYTATFLALEKARANLPHDAKPCVIASDQAHFSIAKAARLVGLPAEALVLARTDGDGRMPNGALREAVDRATRDGFRPFMFVCTGGTTNAGVLEPVEPFVSEARKANAWVHIDGAHGAFRALASAPPEAYWRQADSVAWDPHKSLFATYPAGVLIVRDPDDLAALAHRTDYAFKTADQNGRIRDPAFGHFEGSRGFDALKMWMIIRHFGRDGLQALADHLLGLARFLAQRVLDDKRFELITPPDTNIICFRWIAAPPHATESINIAVQTALYAEGRFLLSRTRIGGRTVLRAVLQNPLTTLRDLDELLAAVRTAALSAGAGRQTAPATPMTFGKELS